MKEYSKDTLKNFKPSKNFFVGIDSDGCAFDTMGIKQRECFCPWMIGVFGLQPVAQAARECKDFADLFSKTRGFNRHKTLKLILSELLPSHPMTRSRGFKVPQFPLYFAWVDDPKSTLSDSGLKKAIAETKDPEAKKELELALQWSEKVNWSVKEIVKGIPPFPFVRESLIKLQDLADVLVVSATPGEALEREWEEHGIAKYVKIIAGQEMGTKKEHLALAAAGKYKPENILMMGDALGDYKAAKSNNVLYFPINPGQEEKSWELFYKEGMQVFLEGKYAGAYEKKLFDVFDSLLPEKPYWQK